MIKKISKYKVNRTEQLGGNCRIWMTPTNDEPIINYKAGQFAMFHKLDADGNSILHRPFSLAIAPSEAKSEIELGVKRQGEMSQSLCDAKIGQEFGVEGPFGVFTLDRRAKKIYLFAGGVGMSPFRSVIRESLLSGLNQELVLFNSVQTKKALMYHDEFVELAGKYKNFKYIPSLTRECPKDWQWECGRFDEVMLKKYIVDFTDADIMMCGPSGYMDAVKDIVQKQDPNAVKRLRFEYY